MPSTPVTAVTGTVGRHVVRGLAGTVTRDVEEVLGRPPTPMCAFIRDYQSWWGTSA